jgi:hypothetical protein
MGWFGASAENQSQLTRLLEIILARLVMLFFVPEPGISSVGSPRYDEERDRKSQFLQNIVVWWRQNYGIHEWDTNTHWQPKS